MPRSAKVAVHGATPTSTRAFNEADSLEAAAQEIAKEHTTDVLAVSGDVTDAGAVDEIMATIRRRLERIDVLINCEGGAIGAQGGTGANAGKPKGNDGREWQSGSILSVGVAIAAGGGDGTISPSAAGGRASADAPAAPSSAAEALRSGAPRTPDMDARP